MRTRRVVGGLVEQGTPVWERGMNAEQLAAIRHEAGPLALYSGAGSGKTRVVVHRVARLVSVGVPADRILCTTFSRAGANEMTARVRKLGCAAEVRTWHALCGRILREEGTREGQWKVDDTDRAKLHVKAAMGYKHENWVGGDLTKVRRFIGTCKANLEAPDSGGALERAKGTFGHNAQRAVRVYSISQQLIEDAGLLTFDDMLVYVARYFAENDDMRRCWAAKFDHVIVDEGQDNNLAQKTLFEMLSRESRNAMLVGDPGQAIFGFRGSTPEYLSAFPADWPGATVVTMAKNYRSSSAVVRVANDVIREGAHRLPEDMTAERGVEGEVRVVPANTLDDEARELVSFAKSHVEGGGALGDITVLYRLNAQSRALEEALLKERLPYVIVGGTNFYERKEVKDLLAYLRLAMGRDRDGDAVRRCINAPFRFLGARFVEKVDDARRENPAASWLQCVEVAASRERIQNRQRESAREWVVLVDRAREMVEAGVPADVGARELPADGSEPVVKMRPARADEVVGEIVKRTRYIEWLEKEEGEESIETSHAANVRELLRVASAFTTAGEFLDFVEQQVAASARNKARPQENALTMMTVHKSKGLEWPVVWVVGCNEGILPHAKGDLEEERRLFYVACTRARDALVVSYVREMAMKAGLRTVERSLFLDVFPQVRAELEAQEAAADSQDLHVPEDTEEAEALTAQAAMGAGNFVTAVLAAAKLPGFRGVVEQDFLAGEETREVSADQMAVLRAAVVEAKGAALVEQVAAAVSDVDPSQSGGENPERFPGTAEDQAPDHERLTQWAGDGTCLECERSLAECQC